MSSNNSSDDYNNNNNGNNNTDTITAVVALVVSVVALLATFMQVMQQYYASAQGYSQCNEKVMGGWAKTKSRRFRWDELRFEVQFEAPVIFVSPPTNTKGPIATATIYFLDGTSESLKNTWTSSDMDLRKEYALKSEKERIHTADNERASWWVLLYAVQRMETKSREWQEEQYKETGPPEKGALHHGLPSEAPTLIDNHTFTVALQRKRKSWDTMPPAITKPYATTTVCHLIEMIAALGIYWKEFDRKHDRYRAEGNGFMILGDRVPDLGLMFSFQVTGQCQFGRNRVIPADEVKEFCFGYVPTIYRGISDQRRLVVADDQPQDLSSIAMATRKEIAESLTLIGCNKNTIQYFLDEKGKTAHLFPVSFEIVGMLAQILHMKNSNFTYIPNPTPDHWDARSVSLIKMMESYFGLFEVSLPGVTRNPALIARIKFHIESILEHCDELDPIGRLLHLRALHTALEDMDEVLTARPKPSMDMSSTASPLFQSNTGTVPDLELQGRRREVVQDVLRAHIQTVLLLLNERDERAKDTSSLSSLHVPEWNPPSPTRPSSLPHDRERTPGQQHTTFDDMNAAGPDDRQQKFMEVYFEVIRRTVVPYAAYTTERRLSINAPAGTAPGPAGHGLRRRGTSRTQATGQDLNLFSSMSRDSVDDGSTALENGGSRDKGSHKMSSPVRDLRYDGGDAFDEEDMEDMDRSLAGEDVSHDDIWCTLVFRMICWLMLHDFDKVDVQVPKSELRGSRMPVYLG